VKLGRFGEAVDALQTATRLSPDFGNAWINLGEAYFRNNQISDAITALQRALVLLPQANDAALYLAQAYAFSKQYMLAKQQAETVLARAPNHIPALYLATSLDITLGNKESALSRYAQLRALDPVIARKLSQATRALGERAKVQLPD